MNLPNLLRNHLPESKSIIGDDEFILLNRKEYHVTQISPVNAVLHNLGFRVSYSYRTLLAICDQLSTGLVGGDFNIIISDPSMAVAGFYCWLKAGGSKNFGRIYAPKGVGRFRGADSILGELLSEFSGNTLSKSDSKPEEQRKALFTIVIGNTKQSNQTIFAIDRYTEIESGFLVLKDYARVDAFDERDYHEQKGVFPAITFEGHALAVKTAGVK